MTEAFRGLSPTALFDLAAAIEGGSLNAPFSPLSLSRLALTSDAGTLAAELGHLTSLGVATPGLAYMLRLLAVERRASQNVADRTELVWTGPEARGARSRDTSVIVRELFSTAGHRVLVSSFAVYDGRQVFAPLAARMNEMPTLKVSIFLNVARAHRDVTPQNQILKAAGDSFLQHHWPGRQLPEVYYDPRSLELGPADKACLHAKAIVIDDARAFVTSANFTEAAHERNIEAGVLVDSRSFATSLRQQFETLVEVGKLKGLPLARN